MDPVRYGPGRLFRLCGICRRFFDWATAPLVGVWGDDVERYESRNCACGGTHSIVVARDSEVSEQLGATT